MNLNTVQSLVSIFSITILLPISGFKIWRKIDERLTEQDKRLIRIEYQLYENGGFSMKDQMNSVVRDVNKLKINQAVIMTKVGK